MPEDFAGLPDRSAVFLPRCDQNSAKSYSILPNHKIVILRPNFDEKWKILWENGGHFGNHHLTSRWRRHAAELKRPDPHSNWLTNQTNDHCEADVVAKMKI